METQTLIMIAGVGVLLGLVVGIALFMSHRAKREHLQLRFGPEYEREVARTGNPKKAEQRLEQREKRVAKLHITPLAPAYSERYVKSWRAIQARFVDEPGAAVVEADALVRKVMEARGYPMGSFEQNADDISVDHPVVVDNYRRGHAIALKREKGQATTEDLRQAFVHYRALFDELVEAPVLVEAHGA